MNGKESLGVAVAMLLGTLAVPVADAAQRARPGQAAMSDAPVRLVVEHVRANVYMIGGAGGNITVQLGAEGVLLVDSGLEAHSDAVLAEIRKLTDKPITHIFNTHYHVDHTGGNANIAKTGKSIGEDAVNPWSAVWGHENVLTRVSTPVGNSKEALLPEAGWPIDTYFTASQELFFNDEPIQMIHMPNAHTDGDSVVFFRRSDVVVTGDLFNTTMYPYIDVEAGGHINGYIAALNRIIDLAIPAQNEEGGTMIVSGHGRIGDEYDLLVYRDAITIIRDRIQDMVTKGMTLEQVQAAKPTLDYDGIYGATSGFWTTPQFVAVVYNNLKQSPAGAN
jgi:cyclase